MFDLFENKGKMILGCFPFKILIILFLLIGAGSVTYTYYVKKTIKLNELIIATKEGDVKIIKSLINSGVDINAKDKNGWTALMWAIEKDNKVIVKELIRSGAQINIVDNLGQTPLMFAAKKGNSKILIELIDARANINVRDNNGFTALGWANKTGNAEVIQILKKNGAI